MNDVMYIHKADVVYIHKGILLSHLRKNEILVFAATWTQLEIIILSEGSQKENNKYHRILLIHGT